MGGLGRLGPIGDTCPDKSIFGALSEASSHHVGPAVEQQGDKYPEVHRLYHKLKKAEYRRNCSRLRYRRSLSRVGVSSVGCPKGSCCKQHIGQYKFTTSVVAWETSRFISMDLDDVIAE